MVMLVIINSLYLKRLLLRDQHAVLRIFPHVVVYVERGHLQLAPTSYQLHAPTSFLLAHFKAARNIQKVIRMCQHTLKCQENLERNLPKVKIQRSKQRVRVACLGINDELTQALVHNWVEKRQVVESNWPA